MNTEVSPCSKSLRQMLTEAVEDSQSQRTSSKRLGLLIATFALSLSTLTISFATLVVSHDLAMALGAVAVPLAGLNGYSYVGGKQVEGARNG